MARKDDITRGARDEILGREPRPSDRFNPTYQLGRDAVKEPSRSNNSNSTSSNYLNHYDGDNKSNGIFAYGCVTVFLLGLIGMFTLIGVAAEAPTTGFVLGVLFAGYVYMASGS